LKGDLLNHSSHRLDYGEVKKRVWDKEGEIRVVQTPEGALKTPGNHPHQPFKQNSSHSEPKPRARDLMHI